MPPCLTPLDAEKGTIRTFPHRTKNCCVQYQAIKNRMYTTGTFLLYNFLKRHQINTIKIYLHRTNHILLTYQ